MRKGYTMYKPAIPPIMLLLTISSSYFCKNFNHAVTGCRYC